MLQHLFGTPFKKFGVGALALAAVLLMSSLAPAATLTWDPAGDGSGGGGAGNWDFNPANAIWYDSTVGLPDVVWTNGNDAVFGGTGGAVTVDAAGVAVGNITIDAAGYSLSGGNISANQLHLASTVGSTSTLDMSGTTSIATSADSWNMNLYIGENGAATVNMLDSSKLSAGWDVFVGAQAGSSGTVVMDNNSIIENSHGFWIADNATATASITMKGNSQINSRGSTWGQTLALGSRGSATLDMSGTSSISMGGDLRVGDYGSATVTLSDSASIINGTNGGCWLDIARETGSSGTVIMTGNTTFKTVNGDLNIGNGGAGSLTMGSPEAPGNATVSGTWGVHIGRGSTGSGSVKMYGGTFHSDGDLAFDNGASSFTQTGGAVSANGWLRMAMNTGSSTNYDISGGTLTVGGTTALGEVGPGTLNIHGTANVSTGFTMLGFTWWSTGGDATINISDTASLTVRNDGIVTNGVGTKIINLDGGTLNVRYIASWGGGPTTLNLNGGLLQSNGNDGGLIGWINAKVLSGGAFIDTNGHDCGVLAALVDGDSLGGGLTKIGNGTLTLSNTGSNYTGLTSVNGGTLNVTGNVPGLSQVNANATLLVSDAGSVGGGVTVNGTGAKFVQTSSTVVMPVVTLTQGTVDGTTTIDTVNVASLAANVVANGNATSTAALTINNLTFAGEATMNLKPASQYVAALNTTNLVTSGGGSLSTGLVTINATADSWAGGLNYLASYSTLGAMGTADFQLGTVTGLSGRQHLPVNPDPTLDFSIPGVIALNVFGYNPTWIGLVNGNWTTAVIPPVFVYKNWMLNDPSSTDTDFITGDIVTFDDTAPSYGGTTSVVISDANVAPKSVIFNNNYAEYTVSSAPGHTYGIVDNGATPTKMIISGGGSVTLASTNTYSGGTTITQGILNIENASAIGTGALTIDNSSTSGGLITLDNTSATVTGLSTNNPQNWNSSFTFVGSHDLNMGSGTVTLGASPTVTVNAGTLTIGAIAPAAHGLTKTGAGTLTWVGTTPTTGAVAATSLSGLTVEGAMNQATGTATVFGPTVIGDATAAATYNLTGGTFVKNATAGGQMFVIGNGSSTLSTMNISNALLDIQNEEFAIGDKVGSVSGLGKVVMTTGSQITVSGTDYGTMFYVGGHNGGTGILEMHNDASITTHRGSISVGGSWGWWQSANGANGTVTMDGTASITTTSGDDFQIALGDGGHGEITLDGHANITTGGSLKMGDTSGASGYSRLNLNGSSWVKVKELWIGQNSTGDHAVNVNGTSTLTSDGWFCVGRGGGAGVLNVNGGTVKKEGGGNFVVGSLGATGTVYLNSGSILNNSALLLGGGTGGIGYFHLNGGLVQANSVSFDGGTPAASVLYYNGGTLQAIADSGDFVNTAVTQLVQSNGAVIDTNTHAITIAAALVEDTVTPSTGGGLKKIGAGTLTLTGALSYTGDTIVNDGTLTIAGTGELNTPLAKVEVATGATLNAGSITCDTLTIGGGPFSFASSLAPVTPVPEPSTMALLLLAGLSLAGWAIRRFR